MMNILTGPPIWVWAILGYLVFVGVKAFKPRHVSVRTLLIVPMALIALKYKQFFLPDIWVYVLSVLVGASLGFLKARGADLKIFKETKSIEVPGTKVTIFIYLTIFISKFVFGFMQASKPELYSSYLYVDFVINGLLSGFLSGQSICFIYRYISYRTSPN